MGSLATRRSVLSLPRVSVGPDSSIVIGNALAASEGFALGEEDWKALAFMEGFDCYSIWDCYFK